MLPWNNDLEFFMTLAVKHVKGEGREWETEKEISVFDRDFICFVLAALGHFITLLVRRCEPNIDLTVQQSWNIEYKE